MSGEGNLLAVPRTLGSFKPQLRDCPGSLQLLRAQRRPTGQVVSSVFKDDPLRLRLSRPRSLEGQRWCCADVLAEDRALLDQLNHMGHLRTKIKKKIRRAQGCTVQSLKVFFFVWRPACATRRSGRSSRRAVGQGCWAPSSPDPCQPAQPQSSSPGP